MALLMLDLSGYEIRGLLGAELVRRCTTTCAGLAVMAPQRLH
jgi:hypothetical protein